MHRDTYRITKGNKRYNFCVLDAKSNCEKESNGKKND